MAKIFRKGNLTYSPFEMDIAKGDIHEDLKREVGNEHSSELDFYLIDYENAGRIILGVGGFIELIIDLPIS